MTKIEAKCTKLIIKYIIINKIFLKKLLWLFKDIRREFADFFLRNSNWSIDNISLPFL